MQERPPAPRAMNLLAHKVIEILVEHRAPGELPATTYNFDDHDKGPAHNAIRSKRAPVRLAAVRALVEHARIDPQFGQIDTVRRLLACAVAAIASRAVRPSSSVRQVGV